VGDIALLRAAQPALETHRAPIHALRNGNGVWDMLCMSAAEQLKTASDSAVDIALALPRRAQRNIFGALRQTIAHWPLPRTYHSSCTVGLG
jgi:hypothetical protein